MPRLRRSTPNGPGLQRRRSGRGFRYLDAHGAPLTDAPTRARIAELVIPPAWQDVWICPYPNGHIQATGVDAAGRRQYVYHPEWRIRRDAVKHDHVLELGRRLPAARERMAADLDTHGLNRRRVLAASARLLDLGFFRVGGERYAAQNKSYGLATMLREHVSVGRDGLVTFDFTAKSGKRRVQSIAEPHVVAVIRSLRRRTHDGTELLAFRERGRWYDVRSSDINDYLCDVVGFPVSAKDFRTWHGTVLASIALAVVEADGMSPTARKRVVTRAVKEVSDYLGNTPAVCRRSYIDPRVIDRFEAGETISSVLSRLGADSDEGELASVGAAEKAVLRLLSS